MPKVKKSKVISKFKTAIKRKSLTSILIALVWFGFYYYQENNPAIAVTGIEIAVHDGDTIKINGQNIRLQGIDAPELKQICYLPKGKWNCGIAARDKLKELIVNKELKCTNEGKDRYQRQLGFCYADKKDINAEMVSSGYALAYRKYLKKYVDNEEHAKSNKLGIWQSKFQDPENFRRKKN